MKILIALLVMALPSLVFAANKTISCSLDMSQFKADSKMFPLIGDSNQSLSMELKDNGEGNFIGESQVRFENDQSQDPSNSLHGAKAIAYYNEGDGLVISMAILKYDNKNDDSPYKAVAGVSSVSDYKLGLEKGAEAIAFGYINPKAMDPQLDLYALTKSGAVEDYELHSVGVQYCRVD